MSYKAFFFEFQAFLEQIYRNTAQGRLVLPFQPSSADKSTWHNLLYCNYESIINMPVIFQESRIW